MILKVLKILVLQKTDFSVIENEYKNIYTFIYFSIII